MTSSAVAQMETSKVAGPSTPFPGITDPEKAIKFIRELMDAEGDMQERRRELVSSLKNHYNLSSKDQDLLFHQQFGGARTPDDYLIRLLRKRRRT